MDKWNDQHSVGRVKRPFFAWPKLLVIWLLYLVWVKSADWVNRDTQIFDLGYGKWNPIVFFPFLVALVVMLVSFKAPGVFVHRRRFHEWGNLKVLPWTIVIAAVFVFVSRIFNLQPGYLYGVIIGVAFLESGVLRDEALESTAGMLWALFVAIAFATMALVALLFPDAG